VESRSGGGLILLRRKTPLPRRSVVYFCSGAHIRREIKPLGEKKDYHFPFDQLVAWVKYWESVTGFDERLLQSNVALTLHVLQNLSTNKVKYERNAGQIDHIFPRAELRKKELFAEPEINHFGNFWILAKGKNQNKSDKHPAKFFEDVSDPEMQRALIDRDMLDYRRYRTFLKERSDKILEVVSKRLGFSEADFASQA
jgi:hypothetical protein